MTASAQVKYFNNKAGFSSPFNFNIMCLFEGKLKNIKYLPNKKNGGIAPELKDKRIEYISTGCGWCSECRKKIANDWRIRLTEEIKENKNAIFVTLSFSPENICKLEKEMYLKKWRGIENDNGEMITDVNLLAAYAVRMWTERWRKYHKKAPKHWLITELGHKNSERIHLHGLIWGSVEDIERTWKYGNIFCGKWVDERTINYIVKYITKLDTNHKGYKQKILTSKGMGKNYVSKMKNYHEYKGVDTIITYKNSNGTKCALPRYYKEKLWDDEQRENIWINEIDKNTIYLGGEKFYLDKISIEEFNKKLKEMRHHNNITGYGDNTTVNKTYYITELMRLKKEDINDFKKEKLVYCDDKRYVENIVSYEGNEISKANNKNIIFYGNYRCETLTEAQRNYNELLNEARELKISIRVLRLKKAGII